MTAAPAVVDSSRGDRGGGLEQLADRLRARIGGGGWTAALSRPPSHREGDVLDAKLAHLAHAQARPVREHSHDAMLVRGERAEQLRDLDGGEHHGTCIGTRIRGM
jgi:hypothetical protein